MWARISAVIVLAISSAITRAGDGLDVDTGLGTSAINIGGFVSGSGSPIDPVYFGQTFVPGIAGALGRVELACSIYDDFTDFDCFPTTGEVAFRIQIRSTTSVTVEINGVPIAIDRPTDEILAQATVPFDIVSSNEAFPELFSVHFPIPAVLEAKTPYVVVIEYPGIPCANRPYFLRPPFVSRWYPGTADDAYSGGRFLHRQSDKSDWSIFEFNGEPRPMSDITLRTYMDPVACKNPADMNGDGLLDLSDIVDFVTYFQQGCR